MGAAHCAAPRSVPGRPQKAAGTVRVQEFARLQAGRSLAAAGACGAFTSLGDVSLRCNALGALSPGTHEPTEASLDAGSTSRAQGQQALGGRAAAVQDRGGRQRCRCGRARQRRPAMRVLRRCQTAYRQRGHGHGGWVSMAAAGRPSPGQCLLRRLTDYRTARPRFDTAAASNGAICKHPHRARVPGRPAGRSASTFNGRDVASPPARPGRPAAAPIARARARG